MLANETAKKGTYQYVIAPLTLSKVEFIAFDADDTLWHNEPLFAETQVKFKTLLAKYHSQRWIEQKLYETELRNIRQFGYGIKGFTLSMIETAIDLTEGRITGAEIREIIQFAHDMLGSPVELLDGVRETIAVLAERYPLMIITKGDLFDQESKIARSGLSEYFTNIEIVTEKDAQVYAGILRRHQIQPSRFVMVGNSVKFDVLPVIEAGGRAIHIPYKTTWIHDAIQQETDRNSFFEIERISLLPDFLDQPGTNRE